MSFTQNCMATACAWWLSFSLCVSGITSRDYFHTSRHPNCCGWTIQQLQEVRKVGFRNLPPGITHSVVIQWLSYQNEKVLVPALNEPLRNNNVFLIRYNAFLTHILIYVHESKNLMVPEEAHIRRERPFFRAITWQIALKFCISKPKSP